MALLIPKVNLGETAKKQDVLAGKIPGLKINNMMTSVLELVKGIEVVVSHVKIPPNTTLPKHWHPGEEFIYILEGSVSLWQKDRQDRAERERPADRARLAT